MRPYGELVRLGWGLLLLGAPREILAAVGAPETTRGTVAVTRLLGARHVAQGGVTLLAPTVTVRRCGAAADLLHASTAVALAAARRPWRRVATADALLAAGFAAIG